MCTAMNRSVVALKTYRHPMYRGNLELLAVGARKVLGQKFPYTQVQLHMMPSLNLLDPHNHNLESLSSWHTS